MNLFDFDDVLLTPSAITRINSRSEINPFDDKGGLPLFTAPMDTVVNTHNAHYFKEQGVKVILPRTVNTDLNPKTSFSEWISYGLNQFEEVFIKRFKTLYSFGCRKWPYASCTRINQKI